MTAPTSAADVPVADAPVIEIDLPCAGCGYNLRTLSLAALCPECGAAVLDSHAAYELHRAELGPLRASGLPWLRAMRQGVGIAALAWCLSFVGIAYGVMGNPGAPYGNELVLGTLWLAPLVGVWVVSHWSVWHLLFARRRRWTLRLGRVAVVLAMASVALLFLNDRWARFYQQLFWSRAGYVDRDWTKAFAAAGSVLVALWPLITAAAFGRFVQIAWIARRRVATVLLSIIGLLITGGNAFLTYVSFVFGGFVGSASGEIAPALVGPTGTCPFVWTGLVEIIREISRGSLLRPRNGIDAWELLGIAIVFAVYAAMIALGILLFSLRRTLTRAILLSEASGASSRS